MDAKVVNFKTISFLQDSKNVKTLLNLHKSESVLQNQTKPD